MLKRITDSHERCNRLQNDRRKAVEAISPEGLVCSNMAYLKYRVRLLELELEDLASGDTSSLSMRSPASKKGIKQFKKEWGVAEMMLSALQTELLGEAAGISAAARLKMLHAVPSSLPTTQIINQQATVAPSDPPPPYSSPTATKSHHLKRQRVSKPQMHQSALTGTDPEGAWFESSLHKKASPDMLNVRIPRRQSSRPKIASLDQLLSRSASA